MPPHCDSLDGPVVTAARDALAAGDVTVVLPYVPAIAEDEVREAFAHVSPLQAVGGDAGALAQLWFFETVVRLHRAGEGAPYTGLKPAGLDVGPVIPLAEKAIGSGKVDDVYRLLAAELRSQLEHRLNDATRLAPGKDTSVAAARDHVQALLGFEVYAHRIYEAIRS